MLKEEVCLPVEEGYFSFKEMALLLRVIGQPKRSSGEEVKKILHPTETAEDIP